MFSGLSLKILVFQISTTNMTDPVGSSSSDPSCSSCVKLQEALEASKREHSLTLRMVKEKIISTDELIKKYQQKCLESEKNLQQATESAVKFESAQTKIDALQSQLERSLHSTEPLRKNVTRLHREKSLADSSISELRDKVQRLEKLNSELMSTVKIKDEQECAWRLEKQVQAHEVQKQKTSLEKSEVMIGKLQEQLKKEKEQNKEISKSLAQANRKAAKLEQQLQKSKEEIESAKLHADLARALEDNICGEGRTPKLRQKRKTRQTAQPCMETKQHPSPVSHPNQHMAHIMHELKVLSDIGPVLSPLPPSPDRDTLESSSASEESDIDSGDDEKASDSGGSDSSLGDLAEMIIGDNTDPGEFAVSPLETTIDTAICEKEIVKNSGESTRINNNADNENTEHEESLNDKTPNEFCASENVSLSNCATQSNPKEEISERKTSVEQVHMLNQIHETLQGGESCSFGVTKTKEQHQSLKTEASSKGSKFTAVPSSSQRKGKRRVTSPKPRVMTRSRTKAMKLSVSSEGDSSSEIETGKYLNSSHEHCSESSDIELERNLSARNARKLDEESVSLDIKESHGLEANNQGVCLEEKSTDSTCHQSNIHRSLSSVEKKGASGCISSGLTLLMDATTTTNNNNNNNPAELGIERESESVINNSDFVDTSMKQMIVDKIEISSVEVKNNNSDSASALKDNGVLTNKESEQVSPQDDKNTSVSKNISASKFQAKEPVLEKKEATLEENNNEIPEDVATAPEELEFHSAAISLVVDGDSSEQNELPLQEADVVSSCTPERENSDLPKLSKTCLDDNEKRLPEQVRSVSEEEIKAGPVSCEELPARAIVSCLIEPPKDVIPGESNCTGGVDVNHPIATQTATSTSTKATLSAKKTKDDSSVDSNLVEREDVHFCTSSIPSSLIETSQDETCEIETLSYVATETTTTTVSTTMGSSDQLHKDGASEDTLEKDVIVGTSDYEMQHCSFEENPIENLKTENEQREETTKTSKEENVRGLSSGTNQEVKETLISIENRKCAEFESDNGTFRTTSKKAGKYVVPSLFSLDAESELQRTEPLEIPLSPKKADSPEKAQVNPDLRCDSPVNELISNLGEFIGDQFRTLSPLPPSPGPSCHASPLDDLDDFPPLSPLPPSPSSVVDDIRLDSSISVSDFSKQTQKRVRCATTITSTQLPQQRHLTPNYAERSSKSIIQSSGGNTCDNTKKSDKLDMVDNRSAESKIPGNEKKLLKRSLQEFTSEAAKGVDTVPQWKKMKTCQIVNQTQESSTLFDGLKAPFSSLNSVSNEGPMTANQLNQPSINIGTNKGQTPKKQLKHASKNTDASEGLTMVKQLKQPSKTIPANKGSKIQNTNVINSKETGEPKDSKYRPLSVRPRYSSEVQYVLKCLGRLHEDNVEINVVVARFTTKRCLSSSTPLVSAIVKFLKQRQDDMIPQILHQLKGFQSDECPLDWKPVISGFETRLMDVLTQLCSNDIMFGNYIPQMVTLCSRSLISSCRDPGDDNFRGALSLGRILTSLCKLQEDLNCIRVTCYDIMRSLYANQDAALELVVTMVTVWPEVLKMSSDCLIDKQSLLVRTLKMVLLNWAGSSLADLGNILRVLCCWEGETVTQETMKDYGLQLIKWLLDERMASVCIGKDGTLVTDIRSFELVKSLELLSCVLGWQWTINELIINNIWQMLQSWAGKETDVEMDHSGDVVTYPKQNESLEGDQGTSTKTKSSCSCQTTLEESEGLGNVDKLSGVERGEICSKCGNLTGDRLAESQILIGIQLLGVLCRVAIENQQSAVPEIEDLLYGLLEQTSSNSKVTYAIHLAAAVSLLDLSPWQPKRVITVLGKWLKDLKESGSPQAPACVTQGLVCLKSIVNFSQNDS